MKKSMYVLFSLCLLFSACSNDENADQVEPLFETCSYSVSWDESLYIPKTVIMDVEFYEQIANNPIDIDIRLGSAEDSSEQRIMTASIYADAWSKEADHALDMLKEVLLESDYEKLVNACSAREIYMENMKNVEQSLFYAGSEYRGTANSDTYPVVMEVYAARAKDCAIELLSLEYALIGEVDFIYNPKS